MRRALSVLLTLCLFLCLFTGNAYAAKAAGDGLDIDLELGSNLDVDLVDPPVTLFVKKSKAGGLDGKVTVNFDATGLTGTLYLPGGVNPEKLSFSWKEKGIVLSRGGKTYKSGKAPVAAAGERITYKVNNGSTTSLVSIETIQGSSSVEPMFLSIDEKLGTIEAMKADEEHDTSCYGTVKFDGNKNAMSIKGRGNSTWTFAKKPYNITLYKDNGKYDDKKKVEYIDGVKAKKWSLLANHLDNSLLRNKIAMDLADDLGIGLKARFVDLYMNGEYLGNYLMTPKTDYNAPDTGYMLENDNYVEETDQFEIPGMFEIDSIPGVSILGSGYHNRMRIVDIGDEAAAKGATNKSIEKHFLKAWAALEDYDSEEYQKYFDIDSWAKMYLMVEVSKLYDCYAGSLFMHRDGLTGKDKIIAGPAWDYDVCFGRTLHKFFVGITEPMQMNAEGWYIDSIGLELTDNPVSLLQELGRHKSFRNNVAKVYREYEWAFQDLDNNVTRQAKLLEASALMNNELWGTHNLCAEYVVAPDIMSSIGTGKYKLNYEVTTSWNSYVRNMREFCAKRVLWLSDHL